jgi:hypothetical protein
MSRVFGTAFQAGYVVDDLDAAIEHWTQRLGIGPFYKAAHLPLEHYEYRGVACRPDLSIALAYSGALQIELIQQHNDAASHYQDFRQRVGTGLHHLCTWNGQTLDDNIERLAGLGYRIASSGKIAGGSRFVYFDTEIHPGTVIEMGESQPATRALFERIRQASIDWDGQEPVRPLRF